MRNFAALGLVALAITAAYAVGVAPIDLAGTGLVSAVVVQGSYSETMDKARAGMIADMSNFNTHTRVCETQAGIGFGLAVAQGATDKGAVLGGALAAFSGISVRDVTLEPGDEDVYQQGANMAVLTEGPIWVVTGAAVEAGQVVHYNATTGVLSNAGGEGPIVGARWLTSAGSGELAKVHLGGGLPGASA